MSAPTYGQLMRVFQLAKSLRQQMYGYSKHPVLENRSKCVSAGDSLDAALTEAGANKPEPLKDDQPMLFPIGGGR